MDFADILLFNLAAQIRKYIKLNNYTIKLIDNQQLSYKFIYNLRLIKFEVLKIYIKIHLANNFIRFFKFSSEEFIHFVKKFHKSFLLYVAYQSQNNFKIKNECLLSKIAKFLDQLRKSRNLSNLF